MENLICLKEIDEPYLFHSLLKDESGTTKTKYCVLAENYFIMFKSISDVISFGRIPLNLNTKIKIENDKFTIASRKFSFTFSHEDPSIIQKWFEILEKEIKKDNKCLITDFYAEEVEIDKIKTDCCSILIDKNEYKLLIYESHKHHVSEVVRHIINLRYYNTKNIEVITNNMITSLSIKGANDDLKITFKDKNLAILWQKILCRAITQYSCCSKTLNSQWLLSDDIESTSDNNDVPIFEGVFNISCNESDKIYLFLVCLYKNRIVIKVENTDILAKGNIDVCIISLNYINCLRYSSKKDVLQISVSPQCNLLLIKNNRIEQTDYLKITNLFIYDNTVTYLNKFKINLFDSLLVDDFEPPNEQTSLFLLCDVQINKEGWLKCRCHITNNELILSSPINLKFDLTTSEKIIITENKLSILIRQFHCDIFIQSNDNQIVLNCLEEASKIRLLSLKNDYTVKKLEELIQFITTHGLKSEGIFRVCGQSQSVERLFKNILETQENYTLKLIEYTVQDVASCLKKCIPYLTEPLIPDELFIQFKHASHTKDKEKKKYKLKNVVKLLPETNYKLLRQIIELLSTITQMEEFNHMDCNNLCISTVLSFISSKMEHMKDCISILQILIENFVLIFDYTSNEQSIQSIFIKNLKSPSQISVIRTLYACETLKSVLNKNVVSIVQETKLVFDNGKKFISISINVGEFKEVKELYKKLFDNVANETIDLWHFITIKNKIYKRLLYLKDEIKDSIINSVSLPNKLCAGTKIDNLVFILNEKASETRFIGSSYRCDVKAKNVKNNILMVLEMPNSLKIFDSKSGNKLYCFKLSEINLYRAHFADSLQLYILYDKFNFLCCEFENTVECNDFILYFDTFRIRDISLISSL